MPHLNEDVFALPDELSLCLWDSSFFLKRSHYNEEVEQGTTQSGRNIKENTYL